MPSIDFVMNDVISFIGDDVIIGHNTSFDIRFLNAGFNTELGNQYMDTMQFARKLFPELKHHRLSDLTAYLGLSNNEHRAIADSIATKELYDSIKDTMKKRGVEIQGLWIKSTHGGKGIDIKSIQPTEVEIDEDNFFYNRHVVFSGKLEKMIRQDAIQIVVNLGGILDNSVTKTTNYLILGNNDYSPILKGEKSSKHRKAEKLKLDGQDIEIIDESTYYDLLES
ncbi:DNA polymerase III alpha subunit [Clostridiaceae bacterium JG1575]|nr:DNA polymerase III alpha subunit [Clostridiaceae bacterium JG1575]